MPLTKLNTTRTGNLYVSLTEQKEYMSIDFNDDDAKLTNLLNAAEVFVSRYIQKPVYQELATLDLEKDTEAEILNLDWITEILTKPADTEIEICRHQIKITAGDNTAEEYSITAHRQYRSDDVRIAIQMLVSYWYENPLYVGIADASFGLKYLLGTHRYTRKVV